jgi:O-acetyl-ADP-ribose deacetylase (regulator of RNase III)
MRITIGETVFELVEGDITEQAVDAIVNAAHWDLAGGQGTDGIIHFRGGPAIMAQCRKIGGCPIGGAVITTGGSLPARYVIHAVGPVYDMGDEYEQDLLASAYQESLRRAVENGLKSVAFPSLSTGAFVYPLRLAAPVALRAILDFLTSEKHGLELVRLVLYAEEQPEAYSIYANVLDEILEREKYTTAK